MTEASWGVTGVMGCDGGVMGCDRGVIGCDGGVIGCDKRCHGV